MMDNRAGAKLGDAHGIGLIEQGLTSAHAQIDLIFNHLTTLNERLYAPKPQPVPGGPSTATPGSVEGAINHLNSRLRELEHLAQTVLHG